MSVVVGVVKTPGRTASYPACDLFPSCRYDCVYVGCNSCLQSGF